MISWRTWFRKVIRIIMLNTVNSAVSIIHLTYINNISLHSNNHLQILDVLSILTLFHPPDFLFPQWCMHSSKQCNSRQLVLTVQERLKRVCLRFRRTNYLTLSAGSLSAFSMNAVRSSEKWVEPSLYHTTRRHKPEHGNLQNQRHDNLEHLNPPKPNAAYSRRTPCCWTRQKSATVNDKKEPITARFCRALWEIHTSAAGALCQPRRKEGFLDRMFHGLGQQVSKKKKSGPKGLLNCYSELKQRLS